MNIQKFENELRRCIQIEKDKGVKIGICNYCALHCLHVVNLLTEPSIIMGAVNNFGITYDNAWAIASGWDDTAYFEGPIDKDWYNVGNKLAEEFGIR